MIISLIYYPNRMKSLLAHAFLKVLLLSTRATGVRRPHSDGSLELRNLSRHQEISSHLHRFENSGNRSSTRSGTLLSSSSIVRIAIEGRYRRRSQLTHVSSAEQSLLRQDKKYVLYWFCTERYISDKILLRLGMCD